MPRPKKPAPPPATPAAPQVPPSKTSHLFSPRPAAKNPGMTHERIAADLDAFHKAGGKIEVLGVTRSLTKIDGDDGSPPPAPAKPRR
ncbi:hypothetical protein [Thermomonas sp.]|uniref:hypothetical protein n=1 Tax=Thermomonas sp. TaxID=1971895 RepID=UPI0025F58124|nr:hypothetical protein [Thermomonas sp.]